MKKETKRQVIGIPLDFFHGWRDLQGDNREEFNELFWGATEEMLTMEELEPLVAREDVSDVLIGALSRRAVMKRDDELSFAFKRQ